MGTNNTKTQLHIKSFKLSCFFQDSEEILKVFMVAEKPTIAREIADILSNGCTRCSKCKLYIF